MPDLITWDSPNAAWDSPGLVWDGFEASPNQPNSMANDNQLSAELTDAVKEQILAKIAEITALMPFMVNLTNTERRTLPKFGPQTMQFDEKCRILMGEMPALVPGFVSVPEVAKDRALQAKMAEIVLKLRLLCEKADDTRMLAGSELFLADLSFYASVKQAARRNVPGADQALAELKARFPGAAGDDEEEEPAPPPAP